eukprot:5461215-Amphidinium_carterae.1
MCIRDSVYTPKDPKVAHVPQKVFVWQEGVGDVFAFVSFMKAFGSISRPFDTFLREGGEADRCVVVSVWGSGVTILLRKEGYWWEGGEAFKKEVADMLCLSQSIRRGTLDGLPMR